MSKWIVHPKIAKWGKQMFGKKSPLMASKEFDKIMCEPYSKEGWVVMPTKPLPDNEVLAHFLKAAKKSFMENPGIPLCSSCLTELELDDDGNIWCSNCEWVIPVLK